MLDWTQDYPTEPGHYWFYGDPYKGQMGQDFTENARINPQLSLVRIFQTSNSLMAVGDGQCFPSRKFDKTSAYNTGYLGYWAKADIPEVPHDTQAFDGFNVTIQKDY